MNVPGHLWRQRYKAHLQLVSRYTRDMGRSGFFNFLLFGVIALAFFYSNAMDELPADFPYTLFLTGLLLGPIAVSPVRTLLREADTVFLLPLEGSMAGYFRTAFRYSFIGQAVLVAIAVSLLFPLYRHGFGEEAQPFLSVLFVALALKFANQLGNWKEASLTQPGLRQLLFAVRWIGTAFTLVALWQWGFVAAAVAFLLLFAVLTLVHRRASSYPVHWTELLAREKRHQAVFFLFFSWFTDVDELPTPVRRRRWLSWATRRVRFRSDRSYFYLYALSLIRSELTGIVLRLLVIACVLLATSTDPYAAAAIYIGAALMIQVQLSALREAHAHAVMPALYPLPAATRLHAAAAVAFRAQLVALAALTAALLLGSAPHPLWLPLLPAAALAAAAWMRRRMRRARD
ncbi:ABC transporter permease [Paenibacillus koleovorans]|uniref:ABC transporter permease n=1 Tax=Paenibacillus koleovorans TaxID=121608 RepID=UPI000FD8227B|nr:ABC transporter permease [Paenibacillus koleovorans]